MLTFCPFYINYFCHVSTIYVSKKPKRLTICNGEISLQGALCRSMPDHLEQDMAIILLMICYLCYVQFCLQVYDEAKGMLIIVLLVESENMDIVLLHKCTMSIATVNIAFMGSYALLEVTLLSVNCIVVCYCIPFSFFRAVSLLLHNAGANCLANLPTLFSLSWIGWERDGQHDNY